MKVLHPKIKALREAVGPIVYSDLMVRADGKLSTNTNDRIIKGYACVWGVPDTYGTVWIKGAFSKSIQERGPDSGSKLKIVCLWQHITQDPIGRILVLREDDYGLYFEAEMDEGVVSAERALKQVRSGTINQFSFGFNYVWDKMEYDEQNDWVICMEGELFEISPVTRGAQKETYAIRSAEEQAGLIEELNEDTELFIRSIPRANQLEARQLFSRHISLRGTEPVKVDPTSLQKRTEPVETAIDYNFLTENLKLF
jgi:uncharacterized protein